MGTSDLQSRGALTISAEMLKRGESLCGMLYHIYGEI